MRGALFLLLLLVGLATYIIGYRHYDRKGLLSFAESVEANCLAGQDEHVRMANYASEINLGETIPMDKALKDIARLFELHDESVELVNASTFPKKNGSREYELAVERLLILESVLLDLYAELLDSIDEPAYRRVLGFRVASTTEEYFDALETSIEAQQAMLRWNRAIK